MSNKRSITLSRKGVVITVEFLHDGDTRKTMKIASNYIRKVFDPLIFKLGMLNSGFIQETASPKRDELALILEEDAI